LTTWLYVTLCVQVLVYKDDSLPVLFLTWLYVTLCVQVLVYKDDSLPVLLLCAVKCQQWPPSLLQHITDVGHHLSAGVSSSASQRELLSFIPVSCLRGTSCFKDFQILGCFSCRRVKVLQKLTEESKLFVKLYLCILFGCTRYYKFN